MIFVFISIYVLNLKLHRAEDSYSGPFGSTGVVLPGESYEFLFTEANEVPYHCEPHPWMTGTLIVTKQRF